MPRYLTGHDRIDRLLSRLRRMYSVTRHYPNDLYQRGIGDGINSAALAVMEEFDTELSTERPKIGDAR